MDTTHRNCFEIVDNVKYLHYLNKKTSYKRGSLAKHRRAKFILHACSFSNSLSKEIFAYNEDYFLYDENLQMIENIPQTYMYRKNVFFISHNSIKYLLNKGVIRPLEENPSIMAKINLLYK